MHGRDTATLVLWVMRAAAGDFDAALHPRGVAGARCVFVRSDTLPCCCVRARRGPRARPQERPALGSARHPHRRGGETNRSCRSIWLYAQAVRPV